MPAVPSGDVAAFFIGGGGAYDLRLSSDGICRAGHAETIAGGRTS